MALKDALARNGLTANDQSDNSSTSSSNEGGNENGGNQSGQEEGGEGGAGASGTAAASNEPTLTVDDDTLIKAMKERGIDISNFEEVRTRFTPAAPAEPTAEEKAEAERKRKADARAFALRQNLVSTNDLDDFARESAMSHTDLGYQLWKQERTEGMTAEEIAELDEKDLVDEFHDEFSLYADENDGKRKRKEKELQRRVETHLKNKYGKVYSLESEYESHIADQQLRSTYNTNVSEAVKAIGNTLNFTIPEVSDQPFSFKLPEGAIQKATEEFLADASFSVFGKNKLDQAAITDLVKANLKGKYLDQIISYVATTHAQNEKVKAAKGRRGIPEQEIGTDKNQNQNSGAKKNPAMQRHLDQHSRQTGYSRKPATA